MRCFSQALNRGRFESCWANGEGYRRVLRELVCGSIPYETKIFFAVSQQETQVMRLKKYRRLCSRSVGFAQHVEKHVSKPFATRFFKSICTHWSKSTDQDPAAKVRSLSGFVEKLGFSDSMYAPCNSVFKLAHLLVTLW